ncbi:hypothetical protein [Moritella sp. F3]|uniref:hypothetical protein n=1 Tax=Moritella sp. F3 TaxID=2718882 RepID=UPI0018E11C92|nr:hypothetical protein [Moritella sp. F3]GIC77677.1 hypothetical protein FMO001_24040 [Moritella sp. F1]GIC82090.1 hypothetical protein FMO003_23710 [Moritella sp. F3]
MILDPRFYYVYPNLELTVCQGVCYTAVKNKWTFVAPDELGIKLKISKTNQAEFFEKLISAARVHNFTLPADLNTTRTFNLKRIYVTKRIVTTKMVVRESDKMVPKSISFQFIKDDIVSFTAAINNAVKVRDIGRLLTDALKIRVQEDQYE